MRVVVIEYIGVFLFIYRVVIGFLSVLKRYIILCFFHVLSVDFGLVRFISSFFYFYYTVIFCAAVQFSIYNSLLIFNPISFASVPFHSPFTVGIFCVRCVVVSPWR